MLVGKNEQERIAQLVLAEHALQLLAGLVHTVTVIGIDNEDDALGVLEVVSPERPDLVLTTNIPHRELNVPVFDRLDVEAWLVSGRSR